MSAWQLIDECTEAGVVFRPKDGRLRPELTKGRPPEGLLDRVKASRLEILCCLGELTDFKDLGEPPPLAEPETQSIDANEALIINMKKQIANDSRKPRRTKREAL